MITGSNDEFTQVLYSVLPEDLVNMIDVYRRDLFRECCLQEIKKYSYSISWSYYSNGNGTFEPALVDELSRHCHRHCLYRKLSLFQSGTTPNNSLDGIQHKTNLRNPSMTLVLFPTVQHGFFTHSNDLAAVDTSLTVDFGFMFQSENECRILVFDMIVPPYLVNYIIEFPRLIKHSTKEEWPKNFKELCKIMESNIAPIKGTSIVCGCSSCP